MNTLKVTGKGDFTDEVLQSGKIERRLGLISDELPIDTLTFFVYKEVASQKVQYLLDKNLKPLVSSDGHFLAVKRSTGSTIDNAVPGDEIIVYYTYPEEGNSYPGTEVKLGQFFIEKVETVNSILYKISCYSYLGILNKSVHEGGVYNNIEALTLIDELTYPARAYGFTYIVDSEITSLNDTLSGWLPYGNCADNLLHVLFATGWILVPDHGSARSYILTVPGKVSWTIPNSNSTVVPNRFYSEGRKSIYEQMGVSQLDNAETVRLVEHSYFSSPADRLVTLFDNMGDTSAANNALIVFSEPCHDLDTTGTLQIVPGLEGDNYAVVNGNGSLTGYAYSHSQRQLEADTNVINNGKVISIENETLVSFTNSANVLERLVNNQNANRSAFVKYRPVPLGAGFFNQVGDKLTFRNGDNVPVTGHVNSTDYVMSAFPSINADLLLGFIPGPYGMSVNEYQEWSGYVGGVTETWRIPAGVTEVTFVLGGGGFAGEDGANGTDGTDGTVGTDPEDLPPEGVGGAGGRGGAGGEGGKVFTFATSVTPGQTITFYFGNAGENTTAEVGGTVYSSASGITLPNGYFNPLSGTVYSTPGDDGNDGYRGGDGGEWGDGENQQHRSHWGYDDDGTVYISNSRFAGDIVFRATGGGGGGAAYHVIGNDGEDAYHNTGAQTPPLWIDVFGGDGGDGANGRNGSGSQIPGSGGDGGDGGGGGGGGGSVWINYNDAEKRSEAYGGIGGKGGTGGTGEDGNAGWVIAYYRAS